MKALTIWQPWASLVAWGEKRYETRSWTTAYRGPLAIHASVRPVEVGNLGVNRFYDQAFARHGLHGLRDWDSLPRGAVLCQVDLVDVVRVEDLRGKISTDEESFGDYSDGRFAWKFENIKLLPQPIPAIGKQGLWEWRVETDVWERTR